MAVTTGPVYVPAPNPVVPRYGLFNVVTGPLDLPLNARSGGIQYQTATCDLPQVYEVNCFDELSGKAITGGPTTIEGLPFVVYSTLECSTVGLANWGEARVKQWLYEQLRAGEQAVVERAFSDSAAGLSPGLTGNPNAVNLGSASGITEGLSILESWLYERYGLPGIIHAPSAVAAYFNNAYLMEKDAGGVWRTGMTTAISFGNYSGYGPTGQVPTAGSTWLWITGQMAIWRTPDAELFTPPMGGLINQSTNVITTIMEREYVLAFDCFVAAVEVALNPDG